MAISASGLTSFFSQTFDSPFEDIKSYASGYEAGHADMLLQRFVRNKSIRENRIWDYLQVENDPNYSRSLIQNSETLQKLTGKLSIATQMVTILNSKISILRLEEFIPTNIESLLLNFQRISDTNINLMSNIREALPFKMIEDAFLKDLKLQFGFGSVSYYDIVDIGSNFYENFPLLQDIRNTGIRSILSLGLQRILPASMTGIFDDLAYLDLVSQMFSTDAERSLFTSGFKSSVNRYSEIPVNEIVSNPPYYEDALITLADPLGVNIQQEIIAELETDYASLIVNYVEQNVPATVPQEMRQELIAILIDDFNANMDDGFSKGVVALPKLSAVISGINTISYNQTVTAINSAFEKFSEELIVEVGIKPAPQGQGAADYLVNVKRNLEKRLEMKRTGDTNEAFVEIDKFIKSVLKTKSFSEADLAKLNDYMDTVFKTRGINGK